MRKISGHVVSTKRITLSRAAKLISRFAAVDNGSSAAVSMYLQRTADAFNRLVQFHEKRSKTRNVENSPDERSVGKSRIDGVEKSLDGDKGKDSVNRAKKSGKEAVNNLDETNFRGDDAKDFEIPVKERKKKKKKKKRSSDVADLKEKSSRKKKSRGEEAVDS